MKIYTKTGDKGETSLFTGKRVAKTNDLVSSFGLLDELNTDVGFLVSSFKKENLDSAFVQILVDCQSQIFSIGSYLAGEFKDKKHINDIDPWIMNLENAMDEMTSVLPTLKNFILPGGSSPSCFAHKCRVQTRNVERHVVGLGDERALAVVRYLNRLSDFFFTMARWANFKLEVEEPIWKS